MLNTTKMLGLLATAGLVVAGTSLQAAPRAADSLPGGDCTVTAESPLTPRPGDQELKVTVSEPIAGEVSAVLPDSAGVRVSEVKVDGGTVTLRVDASAAREGEHPLTLRAGTLECKGEVKVAPTSDTITR